MTSDGLCRQLAGECRAQVDIAISRLTVNYIERGFTLDSSIHTGRPLTRLERERVQQGMVPIDGGTFIMGSDNHYPEEAPAKHVVVKPFWIDPEPVTNF